MKIGFHGAARTVTGSKHLISLDNGRNYLLDCGLFQGMGNDTDGLNRRFGFDPTKVTALILSHAHIDHCGLIPKLVREGFMGKIYCTPATLQLAGILLEDSAGIQEDDAKYTNKRRAAEGLSPIQPLYTQEDVANCLPFFHNVEYNKWLQVDEDVDIMYTDAGHIIGSAAVHLLIRENGKETRISFSGDVGQYRDIILKSPEEFPQADHILLESTYGNTLHEVFHTTPESLLQYIEKTCLEKRGKLIIPAFSVGRTQEILFILNQLELERRLPDLDYFVDSPLSLEVTEVVRQFPEYFNDKIQKIMQSDQDPFSFRGLKYIRTVEESKLLNFRNQPCIIISASGMGDGGRVKHHISNNIENSRNCILFTGYCEPSSLGGRLLAGATEVGIFGVDHEVHAEIGLIKSMSAHGDYEDLIRFLSCQDSQKIKNLFLVHGEYEVQEHFKIRLAQKGFTHIEIPDLHEKFELK